MKNAAIVLAILFAAADAVPYSKYGRSCKDIGCRSDEVCVIAEEPCSYGHQRDQCGRYPTCQRSNSGASESCTTKICPSGQYCTTKNGRPTCVNTNAGLVSAYDSAGVSSVNGQTLPGGQQQPAVPADPYGSRSANGNPYAKASAPPAEEVLGNRYNNPSPSGNNGYSTYPSGNSNKSNNNVYPPYPSNSRPSGDQYGTSRQPNLPQHNPGWGSIHPGSAYNRRSGATANGASVLLLLATSIVGCLRTINA